MTEEERNNEIKVIILGSIGVGKTCLITRYNTGKFIENLPSTQGANYVQIKKIINNKEYIFNLWDTAGQEKYNSLTKTFAKGAKIVILVYSIIDKDSFKSLNKWLDLVIQANGKNGYSIGVAGNKSDLYKEKDVIPDSKGKEYAKKINALFKATSAKEDNSSIDEFMNELVEDYFKNNFVTETATIRLASTVLAKKEKTKCCLGNDNDNRNRNTSRYSNYSNKSEISSKTADDEVF